jgi:hypothetical protein
MAGPSAVQITGYQAHRLCATEGEVHVMRAGVA